MKGMLSMIPVAFAGLTNGAALPKDSAHCQ